MNAKGISIALVCLATILVTEAKLTGSFTWNNRPCTWTEGFAGGKNRYLIINCDRQGNLPGRACMYRGNPHPCAWYNQNHQAQFYACLARRLRDPENLCNQGQVFCNTDCQDRIFMQENANSYYQVSEGSVDDYYIDNY